MTKPASPPRTWGRGTLGMTDDWFSKRVSECRSLAHCKAAIEAEATKDEPRRERIARLNQQVKQIRGGQ